MTERPVLAESNGHRVEVEVLAQQEKDLGPRPKVAKRGATQENTARAWAEAASVFKADDSITVTRRKRPIEAVSPEETAIGSKRVPDAPVPSYDEIEEAAAEVSESFEEKAEEASASFSHLSIPEDVDTHDDEVPWEQLDARDKADIMMVGEYGDEIFEYMSTLEPKMMPTADYIRLHKDLGWRMRTCLLDWMIDIHEKFHLLPETLFHAINLVDRFLSVRICNVAKLQLVGITALVISSKYEEMMAPTLENFAVMLENRFDENDIKKAERYILKSVKWDLCYPSPLNWLRRLSKGDDYHLERRTVAKYLIEVAMLDHRCCAMRGSLLAATAMYLARVSYNIEGWTPNMVHYSGGYTKKDMRKVLNVLVDVLSGPIRTECLFKKYAGRRGLRVATYMRVWIKEALATGNSALVISPSSSRSNADV